MCLPQSCAIVTESAMGVTPIRRVFSLQCVIVTKPVRRVAIRRRNAYIVKEKILGDTPIECVYLNSELL